MLGHGGFFQNECWQTLHEVRKPPVAFALQEKSLGCGLRSRRLQRRLPATTSTSHRLSASTWIFTSEYPCRSQVPTSSRRCPHAEKRWSSLRGAFSSTCSGQTRTASRSGTHCSQRRCASSALSPLSVNKSIWHRDFCKGAVFQAQFVEYETRADLHQNWRMGMIALLTAPVMTRGKRFKGATLLHHMCQQTNTHSQTTVKTQLWECVFTSFNDREATQPSSGCS